MNGGVLVLSGTLVQNMQDVVGKPDRKRPLRTLRFRWADNIKIVRKEIGC